jgi:hypothetical protein
MAQGFYASFDYLTVWMKLSLQSENAQMQDAFKQ